MRFFNVRLNEIYTFKEIIKYNISNTILRHGSL